MMNGVAITVTVALYLRIATGHQSRLLATNVSHQTEYMIKTSAQKKSRCIASGFQRSARKNTSPYEGTLAEQFGRTLL